MKKYFLLSVALLLVIMSVCASSMAIAAARTIVAPAQITNRQIPTKTAPFIRRTLQFTLSPDVLYAGQTSIGVVTLMAPAPDGGARINLSCDKPLMVSIPAVITLAARQSTASFQIGTTATSTDGVVKISATDETGVTISKPLQIVANAAWPELYGLTAPASFSSWETPAVTVRLTKPAPAGGAVISLSSNNQSLLVVPASVTVPAGQLSHTFTIRAGSFSASGNATLTAIYQTSTKSSTIQVLNGSSVTRLSGVPAYVKQNSQANGTVTIAAPAPIGGWSVPIYVRDYTYSTTPVAIPTNVIIPAGQRSGTFTITTQKQKGTVLIYADAAAYQKTADCNEISKCQRFQVVGQPALELYDFVLCDQNGANCKPSASQIEAGKTIYVYISLGGPFAETYTASLTSSNAQVAAPAISSLNLGGNNGWYNRFPIKTYAVNATTPVTISAAIPGQTTTIQLQVLPGVMVTGVSVSPVSITGGAFATGTITLNKAAPSDGLPVSLTSSNPSILVAPGSVTVPAGQTSTTFIVSTVPVLSKANISIGASYAGAQKTTSVFVTP
ncbi:MAG: hypothetical protein LWW87_07825 [Geobacteraceae bacterium]|nr:hypothetical protein [Geobacteraceae bacterium]